MEVEELATPEDVARRVAAIVDAEITAGARHVCLTGGTSPLRAYELLDAMDVPWGGVELWYGDERCVAPDDPESNHGAARARLRADGASWHRMRGELGPADGARAYAEELGETTLDLLLLGLGPDGHIASLFPGFPHVEERERRVVGVTGSPKPPPERITLTLPVLNAARRIVLLVTGAAKAEALARVLTGPDPETPGSLLDRTKLLVVCDAAAMGDAPA